MEDRIRTGKDTGFGRFPSRLFAINAAWLELALTAIDLLASTKHLLLDGDLAAPSRRPCATDSCTWPPASPAVPGYASPRLALGRPTRHAFGRLAASRAVERGSSLNAGWARLTIVFAAPAVSCWIEDRTGWSIKKFVRNSRRYAPSGSGPVTTPSPPAGPLPDDVRDAVNCIHGQSPAH